MKMKDALGDIGHPVAYYPQLALILGDVKMAILICQLVYWLGKQHDPDGWIRKGQRELTLETGLSRAEQESARRKLRALNVLKERKRGIPPMVQFFVCFDALSQLVGRINNPASENGPVDNRHAEMQGIDLSESSNLTSVVVAEQSAGMPQNITGVREFTETTPETLAESMGRQSTPPHTHTVHEQENFLGKKSAIGTRSSQYYWGATVPLDDPVHVAFREAANVTEASTLQKKRELEEACAARLQAGATVEQVRKFVATWWGEKFGPAFYGRPPSPKNLRDDWEVVLQLEQRLQEAAKSREKPRETEGDKRLRKILGLEVLHVSEGAHRADEVRNVEAGLMLLAEPGEGEKNDGF